MELKEVRIKNLVENEETEIQLMLKGTMEKKTANGKADDNSSYYVIGTFSDRKDSNGINRTISVKFWGTRKKDFDQKFPTGTVMDLFVKASLYHSSMTYVAGKTYGKVNPDDYEITDFMSGAPISADNMYAGIRTRLAKYDAKHQDHRKLVESLLERYGKDLAHSAGASSNHHAYLGGCLFHAYRPFMCIAFLPYRNYTASLKQYVEYVEKAKATYNHAELSAEFIGEHTQIPVTEKQRELIFNCFDENPYLKKAVEPLASLLDLKTYDLKRVYYALQICSVIAMNYSALDAGLMHAAILLLACDVKKSTYSILFGRRFLLSELFDDGSEKGKMLVSLLHSASVGTDSPDHDGNLPESFVIGEVWEMAKYSCIDLQLLAAAYLIHDIGKIAELDTDTFGNAEYSTDGQLQGHILIGIKMVKEMCTELEINPDTRDMFLHIIASHHGRISWESLAEPAFPEAAVVHHLDMIDSRMDMYEKVLAEMEPGTVSDKTLGMRAARVYKKGECFSDET